MNYLLGVQEVDSLQTERGDLMTNKTALRIKDFNQRVQASALTSVLRYT